MLEIKQTNTILYCEKWQETVAFYRDTLKLPVATERTWFVEFRLAANSFVSIANAQRATVASANGDGVTLTWQIQNVAATHQALAAAGVALTPLQTRWGALVTYLYDPEGNRIELWEATL